MLRVGIIGCGDMGGRHAQSWADNQVQIVAVSDVDPDRRQALADKHGAEAIPDWQELVRRSELDAVSVCTPACFHQELACAAADKGLHVLCEKPMALSLAEADAMLAATEAAGVRLGIAHQYRWNPDMAAIGRIIAAGELGTPLLARFQDAREVRPKTAMHSARLSGGPIQDMTGHWFDLMHLFTGTRVESVQATGFRFGRGKQRLTAIDDLAPDTAEIQIRYADGHVCSVGICWGLPEGTPAHGGASFIGPRGMLRSDGKEVWHHSADGAQTVAIDDRTAGHTALIADFVDAIRSDRPPTVDGQAGRQALAVSLAALEAIASGEVVRL